MKTLDKPCHSDKIGDLFPKKNIDISVHGASIVLFIKDTIFVGIDMSLRAQLFGAQHRRIKVKFIFSTSLTFKKHENALEKHNEEKKLC